MFETSGICTCILFLVAEHLSVRLLIVLCSHVTSVYIHVYIYIYIYIYISVTLKFLSHFNCVGAVLAVSSPDYTGWRRMRTCRHRSVDTIPWSHS